MATPLFSRSKLRSFLALVTLLGLQVTQSLATSFANSKFIENDYGDMVLNVKGNGRISDEDLKVRMDRNSNFWDRIQDSRAPSGDIKVTIITIRQQILPQKNSEYELDVGQLMKFINTYCGQDPKYFVDVRGLGNCDVSIANYLEAIALGTYSGVYRPGSDFVATSPYRLIHPKVRARLISSLIDKIKTLFFDLLYESRQTSAFELSNAMLIAINQLCEWELPAPIANIVSGPAEASSCVVDKEGKIGGVVSVELGTALKSKPSLCTDLLGGLLGSVGLLVDQLLSGVGQLLDGVVGGLPGVVNGVVGKVDGLVGGLGTTVGGVVGGLGNTVGGVVGGLLATLDGLLGGGARITPDVVAKAQLVVGSTGEMCVDVDGDNKITNADLIVRLPRSVFSKDNYVKTPSNDMPVSVSSLNRQLFIYDDENNDVINIVELNKFINKCSGPNRKFVNVRGFGKVELTLAPYFEAVGYGSYSGVVSNGVPDSAPFRAIHPTIRSLLLTSLSKKIKMLLGGLKSKTVPQCQLVNAIILAINQLIDKELPPVVANIVSGYEGPTYAITDKNGLIVGIVSDTLGKVLVHRPNLTGGLLGNLLGNIGLTVSQLLNDVGTLLDGLVGDVGNVLDKLLKSLGLGGNGKGLLGGLLDTLLG